MRCFGLTTLGLTLACLVGSLIQAADKENKLPDAAKSILEKAEQWELLSLNPSRSEKPEDGGFHGYKVLGKTVIKDADTRKTVLAALEKGIAENKGHVANCFDPRHGIRASHDGKTVDLVICFECAQIEVYLDGKRGETVLTSKSPEPVLDKVLKDAGIPLAPKAGK